jgi:hypothetical protein
MRKTWQGILLSGLVFPGLGQFALGRRAAGAVFVLLGAAALGTALYRLMVRALTWPDQAVGLLAAGTDTGTVIGALLLPADSLGRWVEGCAWLLVGFCWLGSCLHAGWVGRALDREP